MNRFVSLKLFRLEIIFDIAYERFHSIDISIYDKILSYISGKTRIESSIFEKRKYTENTKFKHKKLCINFMYLQ